MLQLPVWLVGEVSFSFQIPLNWLVREVGRIWWAHRAAGLLLENGVSQRYKIAIYGLWVKYTHRLNKKFLNTDNSIESGAIYSVYMILALSLIGQTKILLANGIIQIVVRLVFSAIWIWIFTSLCESRGSCRHRSSSNQNSLEVPNLQKCARPQIMRSFKGLPLLFVPLTVLPLPSSVGIERRTEYIQGRCALLRWPRSWENGKGRIKYIWIFHINVLIEI